MEIKFVIDGENLTNQDAKKIVGYNDAYSFIWEFQQYLRKLYKYDSDRLAKLNGNELINEIYDEWYSMLKEEEVVVE